MNNTTDSRIVSGFPASMHADLEPSGGTCKPLCPPPAHAGAAQGPGAGTGACVAPLGTNAKLGATFVAPAYDGMLKRIERFALQSVARSILPKSRTAKCLRIRAHNSDVQVWRSKAHGTASYGGLQTCGSVWVCPVCNSKIAERRRQELLSAMKMHSDAGAAVYLLTLTTPHQRGDDLAVLLLQQKEALRCFFRDRAVKKVLSEMGYFGQVRALEVTHGRKSFRNNGWHPHYHFLQFCQFSATDVDRTDWEVRLYLRWVVYCEKAGLGTPSYAHGIKLDDGTHAAQYVTKWGLEDEMTKGHSKKAKAGGETPFDLLRAALADDADIQARALFQEFAVCFKGKHQLGWSTGLKARFKQVEKSDEELAAEKDDRAVLLGLLTVDQWRDVLKLDFRGQLLEIATKGGWEAVQKLLHFIDGARDMPSLDAEFLEMLQEVRSILCAW